MQYTQQKMTVDLHVLSYRYQEMEPHILSIPMIMDWLLHSLNSQLSSMSSTLMGKRLLLVLKH